MGKFSLQTIHLASRRQCQHGNLRVVRSLQTGHLSLLLIFLALPIGFPVYCVLSRGFRGVPFLIGFVGILFVAGLVGAAAALLALGFTSS